SAGAPTSSSRPATTASSGRRPATWARRRPSRSRRRRTEGPGRAGRVGLGGSRPSGPAGRAERSSLAGVKVEIATTFTPALLEAVERLVPQLSRSNPPPTADELAEIVESPATDLFVALDDDGTVLGMATLVVFRIPTGMRAWIEDVVVD